MLQFGEFRSCRICQSSAALIFFGFDFVVHANVESNECVNAALFDGFLIAPFTECNDQLTELRTPVTEVIDTDAIVACVFVKKLQGVTDNGRTEMSDMEGLCNVGGRIVKNDGLALTKIMCAEINALFRDFADDLFGKVAIVDHEIQITALNANFTDTLGKIFRKLCMKLCRNDGRCRTERTAEFKARKCKVAHGGIRRIFKRIRNTVCGNRESFAPYFSTCRGNSFRDIAFYFFHFS